MASFGGTMLPLVALMAFRWGWMSAEVALPPVVEYSARLMVTTDSGDWNRLGDAVFGLRPLPRLNAYVALVRVVHTAGGAEGVRWFLACVDAAGIAAVLLLAKRCTPTASLPWCLSPLAIACFAALSPFHTLSLSLLSSAVVAPALVAISLACCNPKVAMVALGAAVYMDGNLLCLAVPAVLARPSLWQAAVGLAYFVTTYLLVSAYGVMHGDTVLSFQCTTSRPNWGLLWYLDKEMFPDFRPFFCTTLRVLPAGLGLILSVKLLGEDPPLAHRAPFVTAVVYGLLTVLAVEPTMVDVVTSALLMAASYPQAVLHVEHSLVLVWTSVMCLVLGNVFIVAWTVRQSANSNFFYFTTLAWNLALILGLHDVILGGVKFHRRKES